MRAVKFTAPDPTEAPAPGSPDNALASLVLRLDDALPQTQCTRCAYPDCNAYAQAMASGEAPINRCPPGGQEGVRRLAALTGQPVLPLDENCGPERPRLLAVIDEAWCIGCTLCIKACPVDCIVGANKRMHTVIDDQCTGCELCVPVCPVDCISLIPVTGSQTGWSAWSPAQATDARHRYQRTLARRTQAAREHDEQLAQKAAAKLVDLPAHTLHTDPQVIAAKRAVIEAALARARAKKAKQ